VVVTIARLDTETERKKKKQINFGCDRGGMYKKTESPTQRTTKKYGCSFKMR